MGTKERIIEAALEEFTEHGYHGAKIRNICSKAKINIAAVNYHFSGKEALYRHVIEYVFQLADPIDEALKISSPELEPEKFLKTMIQYFVKNTSAESPLHRYRFRMMIREMINPSPFFFEILEKQIKPRFMKIRQTIRKIVSEGCSEKEIDSIGILTIAQCIFLFNRPVIDTLTGESNFTQKNSEMIAGKIFNNIKADKKSGRKK
ncbi:MAG: hypothetical protein A2017_19365 [Lentisphaerae bacterium GWF2_44_16]|nr:MAG: hypothetical protein A2017_19365 [Lentisphaerae bacterium GWF2_44_16]